MARTASKVQKKSKNIETKNKTNDQTNNEINDQTNETTAVADSPNTSQSSQSSNASSVFDFLSYPNAISSSSNDESEHNSSIDERTGRSVIYEVQGEQEDEVDQLPQTSKAKPKSKAKAKSKPKAGRKQEKPAKRKDQVLREIHRLRQSTDLLIPKAPFQR